MSVKRVAVFIDAENVSANYAEKILEEAANYGDVIIKRIFADWSNPSVKKWYDKVPLLSLRPLQQFSQVKGKNSSDVSLVIDVLSSLFEREIDVFCLATSDSDFTSLVQELREREKFVVGFGERKSTQSFVNSFSEFIYLDAIEVEVEDTTKKDIHETVKVPQKPTKLKLPKEQIKALQEIIESLIDEDGRALFSDIGIEMKNRFKDFVPKNYGYKTLKTLIEKNLKSIGNYKIDTEANNLVMFLSKK